jgi:hypothetical protein
MALVAQDEEGGQVVGTGGWPRGGLEVGMTGVLRVLKRRVLACPLGLLDAQQRLRTGPVTSAARPVSRTPRELVDGGGYPGRRYPSRWDRCPSRGVARGTSWFSRVNNCPDRGEREDWLAVQAGATGVVGCQDRLVDSRRPAFAYRKDTTRAAPVG